MILPPLNMLSVIEGTLRSRMHRHDYDYRLALIYGLREEGVFTDDEINDVVVEWAMEALA